jgi:hypothetical protein
LDPDEIVTVAPTPMVIGPAERAFLFEGIM